jgi:hypothetical protein
MDGEDDTRTLPLRPLLYFPPALSADVNRMARRLAGNTGKCPAGGIVTPGGKCEYDLCTGLISVASV